MIEVLFRDKGPAVIVGEATDLEGIAFLRLNGDTGELAMETAQAEQKTLGKLAPASVQGLKQASAIIVTGLFKNTLSWAVEVDLNEYVNPPRRVTDIEITALIQGMAQSGYYGDAAEKNTGDRPRGRTEKPQRRKKN